MHGAGACIVFNKGLNRAFPNRVNLLGMLQHRDLSSARGKSTMSVHFCEAFKYPLASRLETEQYLFTRAACHSTPGS
jgi:hypothetical protein